MLIETLNNEIRASRPKMLPVRCGPVFSDGDCRLVVLPDGTLRRCNGVADGERLMDEFEEVEQCQGR